VNKQITRLAVVAVVLLGSLIVMTTYWQTWAASSLADRQDNALETVAALTVKRGKIYAGRTLVATNIRRRVGGQTLYFRRYPTGGLFAHVVGYSTQVRSRAGLEQALNDFLTGANGDWSTLYDTTLDKLKGTTITGNDVYLTLRPGAQRVAYQQLAGRCGAVVALEPKTGRVLVMASNPTYNPNLIEHDYGKVAGAATGCGGKLLNRATSGLYAPGSTFKVVTAAAALDSGAVTPQTTFDDPGYCVEYGKHVNNAETEGAAGVVTVFQGLQHSINSVFCNIGKKLGGIKILDKAKQFGFYSKPPIDLPSSEVAASGLYKPGRKLFFPQNDFQVDPGRLAFGQERLGVTPLQMAMVAAAVGNNGEVMKPQLVEKIVSPNGKTIVKLHPEPLNRAMKPQTASEINQMMQAVVSAGTGTNAQIPGIKVAGKTGTAETGVAGRNTTWFISFAPADDPKVAVAVVVENQPGAGNTYAAPVAKAVLQALLPQASNSGH
jgi:peptidoglycan glycosyltransferase